MPKKDSEQGDLPRQGDSDTNFYIVGIGASAGGLEALEQIFQAMPADIGMAFVIVQHLSPDFKSLMDELLARYTRMAIYRVENGMEVQPNAIYLLPPKREMIISNGKLLLTEKDASQILSLPIDHFFRSLAQDAQLLGRNTTGGGGQLLRHASDELLRRGRCVRGFPRYGPRAKAERRSECFPGLFHGLRR